MLIRRWRGRTWKRTLKGDPPPTQGKGEIGPEIRDDCLTKPEPGVSVTLVKFRQGTISLSLPVCPPRRMSLWRAEGSLHTL